MKMSSTRPPAIAGTFYPEDPATLARSVGAYLEAAPDPAHTSRILIAPHAGHVYSGPVAASAYRAWRGLGGAVRRVLLIGPSHRVAFRGLALPGHDTFATPLGGIPLDRSACDELARLPGVGFSDQAHAAEHSLEVHLPFLQQLLGRFELVPLVAGQASPEQVCAVLEHFAGDEETLILISTDLSHFHPYEEAVRIDRNTTRRMESLCYDLRGEEACGHVPVNGTLLFAQRHGRRLHTLDLRNSGDTAGRAMRDRVVGYGAYVVH